MHYVMGNMVIKSGLSEAVVDWSGGILVFHTVSVWYDEKYGVLAEYASCENMSLIRICR